MYVCLGILLMGIATTLSLIWLVATPRGQQVAVNIGMFTAEDLAEELDVMAGVDTLVMLRQTSLDGGTYNLIFGIWVLRREGLVRKGVPMHLAHLGPGGEAVGAQGVQQGRAGRAGGGRVISGIEGNIAAGPRHRRVAARAAGLGRAPLESAAHAGHTGEAEPGQ